MKKLSLIAVMAAMAVSAVQAADIPGPAGEQNVTVITEAPEGDKASYAKRGKSWGVDFDLGLPYQTPADGYVAEIVMTDDNKIYMAPAFTLALPIYGYSYIVGDIKDGMATFTFPQAIYARESYGVKETVYALLMEWYDFEDGNFTLIPCEEQTLSFNISDDGTLTPVKETEDTWIAPAEWIDEDGNSHWDWTQVGGDWYTSLTPINATSASIPADISAETWKLVDGETCYDVTVAFNGSDIYIGGIMENMPESVIAGKIADNKAEFPTVNFLGVYGDLLCTVYAICAKKESFFDPDYGQMDGFVPNGDPIVFTLDMENKKLIGNSLIQFSYVDDKCTAVIPGLMQPIIYEAENEHITSIADPEFVGYLPYDDEEGFGAFMFRISNVANDDILIPSNRLFFSVYFNGELYEFDPEDYPGLKEPIALLPYKFTADPVYGSLWFDSDYMFGEQIKFFMDGVNTVGVQAIYKHGDTEIRSKIVTVPDTGDDQDGIVNVKTESAAISYFDLQGRRISAPAPGQIIIKRAVMTDGSAKASKIRF